MGGQGFFTRRDPVARADAPDASVTASSAEDPNGQPQTCPHCGRPLVESNREHDAKSNTPVTVPGGNTSSASVSARSPEFSAAARAIIIMGILCGVAYGAYTNKDLFHKWLRDFVTTPQQDEVKAPQQDEVKARSYNCFCPYFFQSAGVRYASKPPLYTSTASFMTTANTEREAESKADMQMQVRYNSEKRILRVGPCKCN